MYRMHHYPAHISTRKLAAGPSYPWYPDAAINSASMLAPLGAFWELQGDPEVGGGNSFIYVRNGATALAAGDIVGYTLPAASTVTASGSDTQVIVTGGGALTVNAEVGNWLFVRNTTSNGGGSVLRRIKENSATAITISKKEPNSPSGAADIDKLVLAATNGDVTAIIRPWRVAPLTATGGAGPWVPVGVALGTVAANAYTILQVAGLGLVKALGQTTAVLVAGKPAQAISATDGVLTGAATASPLFGAGVIVPLAPVDSATALVIPAQFNFFGNL